VRQPVWIKGNAYLNGAKGFSREEGAYQSQTDPKVKITTEEDDSVWLEFDGDEGLFRMDGKVFATADLELPRIVEAPYENPDGTPICWNKDYLGQERGQNPLPGPFAQIKEGYNRIRVW
jgi:hypothetical protein